jgi:hypothetical protein
MSIAYETDAYYLEFFMIPFGALFFASTQIITAEEQENTPKHQIRVIEPIYLNHFNVSNTYSQPYTFFSLLFFVKTFNLRYFSL